MGGVIRISITNGEKTKEYHAHRNLLSQKSPYFAALSNFREGEESHVTLSNIQYTAFDRVLYWLYKGDFGRDLDPDSQSVEIVIGIWAAADRLMINKCKNMAMDILRNMLQVSLVQSWHLRYVSDLGYSKDSILARVLLEQISYDCARLDWDYRHAFSDEHAHPEMVSALLKTIISTAKKWRRSKLEDGPKPRDPACLVGCRYHEHVEGDICHLTKKD